MTGSDNMASVSPAEIHKRYCEITERYGDEEEREALIETLRLMRDVRDAAGEGARFEPLTEVVLPRFFVSRAESVARVRHEKAKARKLHDKFGVVRSIEQERRTVLGQYAACILLGIGFNDVPSNHRTANAQGNLGGNRSAFIPKEGNFGVLINQDERPTRNIFVMQDTGERSWECLGWTRAGSLMLPVYQREFVRNNVVSRPWIAPSDMLLPLRDWFA